MWKFAMLVMLFVMISIQNLNAQSTGDKVAGLLFGVLKNATQQAQPVQQNNFYEEERKRIVREREEAAERDRKERAAQEQARQEKLQAEQERQAQIIKEQAEATKKEEVKPTAIESIPAKERSKQEDVQAVQHAALIVVGILTLLSIIAIVLNRKGKIVVYYSALELYLCMIPTLIALVTLWMHYNVSNFGDAKFATIMILTFLTTAIVNTIRAAILNKKGLPEIMLVAVTRITLTFILPIAILVVWALAFATQRQARPIEGENDIEFKQRQQIMNAQSEAAVIAIIMSFMTCLPKLFYLGKDMERDFLERELNTRSYKGKREEEPVEDAQEADTSLYDVLGVPEEASVKEIKKAYHKLALENHPDKTAGLDQNIRAYAEERMKVINSAYETLLNMKGAK